VQAANLICGLDEGLSLPLAGWMPWGRPDRPLSRL